MLDTIKKYKKNRNHNGGFKSFVTGQGPSKRPKPLIQQRNKTFHKSRARSNAAVKQLSHGFTMSTRFLKKPISENTY